MLPFKHLKLLSLLFLLQFAMSVNAQEKTSLPRPMLVASGLVTGTIDFFASLNQYNDLVVSGDDVFVNNARTQITLYTYKIAIPLNSPVFNCKDSLLFITNNDTVPGSNKKILSILNAYNGKIINKGMEFEEGSDFLYLPADHKIAIFYTNIFFYDLARNTMTTDTIHREVEDKDWDFAYLQDYHQIALVNRADTDTSLEIYDLIGKLLLKRKGNFSDLRYDHSSRALNVVQDDGIGLRVDLQKTDYPATQMFKIDAKYYSLDEMSEDYKYALGRINADYQKRTLSKAELLAKQTKRNWSVIQDSIFRGDHFVKKEYCISLADGKLTDSVLSDDYESDFIEGTNRSLFKPRNLEHEKSFIYDNDLKKRVYLSVDENNPVQAFDVDRKNQRFVFVTEKGSFYLFDLKNKLSQSLTSQYSFRSPSIFPDLTTDEQSYKIRFSADDSLLFFYRCSILAIARPADGKVIFQKTFYPDTGPDSLYKYQQYALRSIEEFKHSKNLLITFRHWVFKFNYQDFSSELLYTSPKYKISRAKLLGDSTLLIVHDSTFTTAKKKKKFKNETIQKIMDEHLLRSDTITDHDKTVLQILDLKQKKITYSYIYPDSVEIEKAKESTTGLFNLTYIGNKKILYLFGLPNYRLDVGALQLTVLNQKTYEADSRNVPYNVNDEDRWRSDNKTYVPSTDAKKCLVLDLEKKNFVDSLANFLTSPTSYNGYGSDIKALNDSLLFYINDKSDISVYNSRLREPLSSIHCYKNEIETMVYNQFGEFDCNAQLLDRSFWKTSDNQIYKLDSYYNDFYHPNLFFASLNRPQKPKVPDLFYFLRIPSLNSLLENGQAEYHALDNKTYLCFNGLDLNTLRLMQTDAFLSASAVKDPASLGLGKFNLVFDMGNFQVQKSSTPLQNHTNIIINQDDFFTKDTARHNLHVCAIYIDLYPGKLSLSPIPDAGVSLQQFYQLFKDSTHRLNTTFNQVIIHEPLRDTAVTLNGIKRYLNSIKGTINPNDLLVVYFLGHGIIPKSSELFNYITYDAQLTNDESKYENCFSTANYVDFVKEFSGTRLVLVIDACQSGGAFESLKKVIDTKMASSSFKAPQHYSYTIIASSSPLQFSKLDNKGSNLIKLLDVSFDKNKTDVLWSQYLKQFSDNANSGSAHTSFTQTPMIYFNGADYKF